jgi:hypothetical protein
MLVQRCTLDQHRLILPVSVTKPVFAGSSFQPGRDHREYRALVDTGAQRTVVSRLVIQEQKLVRTGHMQFSGLHGAHTHSRFLASIGLWVRRISIDDRLDEYQNAERSLFNLDAPIEVVDMNDNINFDLILGFDVLKQFSFKFDAASHMFEALVQA